MQYTPSLLALSVALFASSAGSAGCAAHAPPQELVDARAAHARARSTAKADPAEIAEAKRFLDAAERWQIDDPGSEETRNLAYLAHRKALIAEADARTAAAEVEQARELQALSILRREQLADLDNRLEKSDAEATLATKPAGSRSAKEAVDRLTPFASVSESRGGMVVTIPDSVLFEGNTATLMATARERLDRVAQALVEVRGCSIAVKGFMDASGHRVHESELARQRADAVRQYLITRGVASDRVRAVGLGAAQPIASNESAEGRQQNRRVEIVVEGMGQAAATH